ncbi:stage II sporulation protein P [Clostridium ganghwense]|uniref:Stage II sporulation protein P n=1 Tax=Clostridium ganghwense TaxID=312089 RepID=A0ABT4CV64_9CLOT|nr:stage II sporulation protein P [Clostridium ganghwense]MCY6371834.1 stage II sporulation protein P [Clostridium ganghwense]
MNSKKSGMEREKFTLLVSILIFLISILLALVLFGQVKKVMMKSTGREISFYCSILDYSAPILCNNLSEKEEREMNELVRNNILNLIGIGNEKSLSIVGKEISYLKTDENYQVALNSKSKNGTLKRDPEHIFDKFTLAEDQVFEEKNQVGNNTNIKTTVYNPKLKKELSSKPEILIYHTHTCESYKPNGINTMDKTQNVCAVGEELKKELEEKYGISVVHDTTVHDAAAYAKSYDRSGVTLDKYMKKYGDFKLIIDLHRDSVENKKAVTANINNENVARFMFVMARKNPHFNKNMQIVNKMINISNKLYPSLCKGTFYYNYGRKFFNQAVSNNAVLLEVGSHINTIDEAKASSKYLARIIAEYLNGKN